MVMMINIKKYWNFILKHNGYCVKSCSTFPFLIFVILCLLLCTKTMSQILCIIKICLEIKLK